MLLRIKIWEKMPSVQSRKSQGINLLTSQKGAGARLSFSSVQKKWVSVSARDASGPGGPGLPL